MKQPEQSVKLFRDHYVRYGQKLRGYFCEWGLAEKTIGNYALDICLNGIALADQIETRPPDNKTTMLSFIAIASSFI